MIVPAAYAADQTWFNAGPTNDWNLTDLNWDAGAAWVDGNNAIFGGTGEAITLTSPISLANLTLAGPGYSIGGASTLTLLGSVVDTGVDGLTISAPLAGTAGLTKVGNGILTLSSTTSTITGTLAINAGKVTLGANNSLGGMSVTLNGGVLERNAAGVTVPNPILVGAGGGTILGRQVVDDYTTFSGPLTGSGALTIQGLVVLNNTANTYAGNITIAATPNSFLRLVGSNIIGSTSNVTLGGLGASFRLDGTASTQTIASFNGTGGRTFSVGTGAITLTVGNADANGNYAGTMDTVGGPFNFAKTGAGTQILSRAAGNGAALSSVTVNSGTLDLAGTAVGFNAGYFTGTTPITVNPGGTLTVKQLWNIGSTNVVTINGGTLTFNGTTTDGTNYMNNLTLQNGATVNGAAGYRMGNVTGVVPLNVTGDTTSTLAANVYLVKSGASTIYAMNVADGASAVDFEVTGRIFDLGQNGSAPALGGTVVRKDGAGTMRLAGANLWVGGTTVSNGTVLASNNGSFGAGTITMGDASTGASPISLTLQQRVDISNAISIPNVATGPIVIGADASGPPVANAASFLGTITANRPFTFRTQVPADRLSADGKVTGTPGTITIDGGSRFTFSNTTNDFTGNLVVTGAGTVLQASVATAAEVIPNTADVTVDAGAVFQLASLAGTETINGLNGAGTVRTFSGGTFGSFLAVGSAGASGLFSGSLLNGTAGNPLSLIKLGAGKQTLTGLNSYTGATIIEAGTLEVDLGGTLSGTPSITLKTGAVLDVDGVTAGFTLGTTQSLRGSGSVLGALTISGTLAPGEGLGAGVLAFNNAVALGAAANSAFELSGPLPADFDRATGITAFALDGTFTVTLINSFAPTDGMSFDLLDWSGPLVDNFNVSTDLILPNLDPGLSWDTTRFETSGVIAVVPEPGALAMLLGGLGVLALRRRKRGV